MDSLIEFHTVDKKFFPFDEGLKILYEQHSDFIVHIMAHVNTSPSFKKILNDKQPCNPDIDEYMVRNIIMIELIDIQGKVWRSGKVYLNYNFRYLNKLPYFSYRNSRNKEQFMDVNFSKNDMAVNNIVNSMNQVRCNNSRILRVVTEEKYNNHEWNRIITRYYMDLTNLRIKELFYPGSIMRLPHYEMFPMNVNITKRLQLTTILCIHKFSEGIVSIELLSKELFWIIFSYFLNISV